MFVKNINIYLEDHVYDELVKMLEKMGQSPQSFFENYTKTVLRDRSRALVVCASHKEEALPNSEKVKAFQRLERLRLSAEGVLDYEKERANATEEKYKDFS